MLSSSGVASAATARTPPAPAPIAIPRASISPADLGVVIAQGDPVSEAIGDYYAQVRGIPPANVIRISIPTGADEISSTDFAAVKAQVDSLLPAGVQATLLTWTQPSRVVGPTGTMSITSAMAFGFDPKWAMAYDGTCHASAASPYFDSNSTHPWTDLGMRPSMMLGESTFAAAKALIDRGLASDGTYPSGTGYLVRTTDGARNVRYPDFISLPALWNHPNGLTLDYIDGTVTGQNWITGEPAVLFYFTGLDPQLPTGIPDLTTHTFVPGAIGDNLTSFGGVLPDGGGNQQPATAFLDAGATGTYGTVEEPCNFTQKFPQASVVIDQYYRGATLIEAYWKSVQWPGEGLFLGEPLARPFADQASSTVQGNEYVISTRSFRSNSRYAIEYRRNANSAWATDADITTGVDQPITWQAPLAPSGDQTRLAGPCPPTTLSTAGSTRLQGGRPQTVDLQLSINEGSGGCGPDTYTLAVEPLSDGLTASLSTPRLKSFSPDNPGPMQYALLQISIPASVGQSTSQTESVYIDIANQRTGQVIRTLRTISVSSSTATGGFLAPAVRLIRPGSGWVLTDTGIRPYQIPVALDVAPTSGIAQVQVSFTPLSGCCSYTATAYPPNFTTVLTPQVLQDGAYSLTATGEDASGNTVGNPAAATVFSNFSIG